MKNIENIKRMIKYMPLFAAAFATLVGAVSSFGMMEGDSTEEPEKASTENKIWTEEEIEFCNKYYKKSPEELAHMPRNEIPILEFHAHEISSRARFCPHLVWKMRITPSGIDNTSDAKNYFSHLNSYGNLVELDLGIFRLVCDDVIQEIARECSKLRVLTLSNRQLGINNLSAFPRSLAELDLSRCTYFVNVRYMAFHSAPHLTKLNLSGSDVQDKHLQFPPEGLVELDLSGCKNITGNGLKYLKNLTQLSVLNLSGYNKPKQGAPYKQYGKTFTPIMPGFGLEHLPKSITKLILWATPITDNDLKNLTHLENLMELHLTNCREIKDPGLAHLRSLPNLQKLYLPMKPTPLEKEALEEYLNDLANKYPDPSAG